MAGWHDVVVDQTERAGGAAARLSIATGPELAGQPLPLDRLRPVEGRGERWESGVDRADRGIPDGGQASSTVTLAAPAGATVTIVDVSYTFSHSFWGDLEVRLIAPNGTVALLRDNLGGNTSGTETQRLSRVDLAGAPVAGTWTLRVNDTATQDTGTLLDFQVTPHYAGGGRRALAGDRVADDRLHGGAVSARGAAGPAVDIAITPAVQTCGSATAKSPREYRSGRGRRSGLRCSPRPAGWRACPAVSRPWRRATSARR